MYDLGINTDCFNPKVIYTFSTKFTTDNVPAEHMHDFLTIVHVLSGSCIYKINNNTYKVKKGSTIILNPKVNHKKILEYGSEITEFQMAISNIFVKDYPKNHLIPEDSSPILSSPEYEAEILKCCNEIVGVQKNLTCGSELMLKSLAIKLVIPILKSTYKALENKYNYNGYNEVFYDKTSLVNSIVDFLNDNYMKELSLDIISQNMYLSPTYISKVFKEEINDSPINYLIKIRLLKAKELLEEGQLSIKEIASLVGYNDAYHFSKLFKKNFGCSPKQYKDSVKYKNKNDYLKF